MDKLYKPSYLKEVLSRHGFNFSKALGQNFLVDGNIINMIIEGSGVEEGDLVIEVGPGAGTLTNELSEIAEKVIAIELDTNLLPILDETTGDNVEIIHKDALKVDFNKLIEENSSYKSVKLVANLPYNVGTTIVARILENRVPIDSMTIMLQKEVADRMMQEPGNSEYGSISLLVNYFTSKVENIATAPKTVFMPQPKIDSQVIKLTIKEVEETPYEELMFKIIRGAFTQRRKTILNSLTVGSGASKAEIKETLEELNINPQLRAGDLSIENFKEIAENLHKNLK